MNEIPTKYNKPILNIMRDEIESGCAKFDDLSIEAQGQIDQFIKCILDNCEDDFYDHLCDMFGELLDEKWHERNQHHGLNKQYDTQTGEVAYSL